MGPDKGRVDEFVTTNGLRPHAVLAQGITLRVATDDGLVVVKTLVHHIPLCHLTFIVFHNFLNMVLQDLQGLIFGPVLVVLLAVTAHPSRQLGMPGQTMAAQTHIMFLCKPYKIVGTAITEAVARRFEGIPFHLVLCHQHIELCAHLLRLSEVRIVQVVFPHRDSRAEILAVLGGIFSQGCLVCLVVDAVVIEGSHRTLWNLGLRHINGFHLIVRYQS